MLKGLAGRFEIIWATAWDGGANTYVSGKLQLPDYPFIDFGGIDVEYRRVPVGLRPLPHEDPGFKTPYLVERAAGRQFVWVDDEISEGAEAYLRRVHKGRCELFGSTRRGDCAVTMLTR